jgi:hypothetical protein
MKTESFPIIVTEEGVSARIRKATQVRNDREYTTYIIDYRLLGTRKREARSDLAQAKQAALDACRRIANGEQRVLELLPRL